MTKISGLKSKIEELKGQAAELQKELMKKTEGVRRDVMLSFNANKQIVMHLYKQAQVYGKKVYAEAIEMAEQMKKTAEEEYKTAKAQAIRMYGEAKADAEVYLKKMKVIAADAYLKVVEMVAEMYNDPMMAYYEAGRLMVQYRTQVMDAYKKYKPIAEAKIN